MSALSLGMPVGPDDLRGVNYAAHAMCTAADLANSRVRFLVALDPKVDTDATRDRISRTVPTNSVEFLSIAESQVIRAQNKCGDVHGELLQCLIDNAQSDIFCVADSDVAFIRRGWDDRIVHLLNKEPRAGKDHRIIVGSESPHTDKFREFPTSMFFAVRTKEFSTLGVNMNKKNFSFHRWPDFGPGEPQKNYVRVTEQNQK